MKVNEKVLNYILSIGFILFIVLIITSFIFIGRFILSEDNPIGNYATTSKNLINDISQVEVSVTEISSSTNQEQRNIERFKFNSFEKNIDDFSILNVNKDKGIISFVFDSEIEEFENIYYLKLNQEEILEEGTDVLFSSFNNQTRYGRIFSIEDEEKYKIFNYDSKEVVLVLKEEIKGKIIFKDETNN